MYFAPFVPDIRLPNVFSSVSQKSKKQKFTLKYDKITMPLNATALKNNNIKKKLYETNLLSHLHLQNHKIRMNIPIATISTLTCSACRHYCSPIYV